MTRKPTHEIRRGLIKARIWEKRIRTKPCFTVTLCRIYRNGDVWKESTQFGRDDLPLIRLVIEAAHDWIHMQDEIPY